MNKAELVQAMADEAGLSKSDAEKALNAFVEVVGGELGKGGKVQLACKAPKFKAGKALKDEVNR